MNIGDVIDLATRPVCRLQKKNLILGGNSKIKNDVSFQDQL